MLKSAGNHQEMMVVLRLRNISLRKLRREDQNGSMLVLRIFFYKLKRNDINDLPFFNPRNIMEIKQYSDGQQFHQYQQNKQSPLTLNH
jgi:hypothetical protein